MIFIPKKAQEKFHLILFIMDSIIYFFLAAFIAVMAPLFFGLMFSGGRRGTPSNGLMENTIIPLYDNNTGLMEYLEIISLVFALIVLAIILNMKLKKFHIYSFEINELGLTINAVNLLKGKRKQVLAFNEVHLIYKPETKEEDIRYDLFKINDKKAIFSTAKNKYWDVKDDKRNLNMLFEELIKLNCKLSVTDKENYTGYEALKSFANLSR